MPPHASALRTHARTRAVPIITTTILSVSLYTAHSLYASPLRADDTTSAPDPRKSKISIIPSTLPYVPLVWGSNRYLTLAGMEQGTTSVTGGQVKKPSPLTRLGGTPLRDLVLAEKYGAAVDARGDLWMWGQGWDEDEAKAGEVGQSLKGKNIRSIHPAPSKLYCLSKSGHLYALSSSRSAQQSKAYRAEQSWWSYLFGSSPSADFVEIRAETGLKRGEKFTGVSTGTHHLLAVTNKGRSFSLPLSPMANSHRQLGTRQVFGAPLLAIAPSDAASPPSPSPSTTRDSPLAPLLPESDPRYCTQLTEIPSLADIQITQIAASSHTSFARTSTGRVLGWGANESGQIGLGPTAIVDVVPTPVEIVLARNYPGGTTLKCTDIVAGGNTTFFVVQRDTPGKAGTWVDLLACGNGMSGALGNGLWSSACPSPVRVKTVSGLQEYSEKANAFIPLNIHTVALSPSPSAHVFAVLDTVREADQSGVKKGLYGRDVMVWGGNADYQLGNGKRSSLAVPQHLPMLVAHGVDGVEGKGKEAGLSSGTLSPMPHSRLQLHQTQADAYDFRGKLIKRNVRCEETVVAGWNASALYNKIID